jgi:hypothetical protein
MSTVRAAGLQLHLLPRPQQQLLRPHQPEKAAQHADKRLGGLHQLQRRDYLQYRTYTQIKIKQNSDGSGFKVIYEEGLPNI